MTANVQIQEYLDVATRAQGLGCEIPSSLAILPRNFAEAAESRELLYEDETPTVRILWREAGVVETPLLPPGTPTPQISEKSFESWMGPTIFVSLSLMSQNPELVSVALSVISNYLTDWFKGFTDRRKAKLDIVVQTRNVGYKKIHYDGPVDGLKDLPPIVKEVFESER